MKINVSKMCHQMTKFYNKNSNAQYTMKNAKKRISQIFIYKYMHLSQTIHHITTFVQICNYKLESAVTHFVLNYIISFKK